jgi:hypothetical protein
VLGMLFCPFLYRLSAPTQNRYRRLLILKDSSTRREG